MTWSPTAWRWTRRAISTSPCTTPIRATPRARSSCSTRTERSSPTCRRRRARSRPIWVSAGARTPARCTRRARCRGGCTASGPCGAGTISSDRRADMTPPFELDLKLQVGKYDIRKMLGKGATGTVYLAVDTFSGKEVALKTIEPEVFRDPEFGTVHRTQFLAEASLAGKLKHPHIVGIFDAVVLEDSGHIAMELVTGGDLSQHAVPGRLLPVADVLQIGFKCCGALDYAHREGIVHRDLKPANIMVVKGTEVKIADFGAALLRKTQALQTASMGSPSYMSPEQIENRPLTYHSDMFSLGVVLYELLTGRKPFVADSIQMLVQKILHQDPPMPSTLRSGVPKSVDAIVLRALGKKPEHRYKTWAELALELSNAVKLVLPGEMIADSEKYVALKRVDMLIGLS